MPVFQGFIGGAYRARSLNFDAQRCVNLYPEKSDSGTSKAIACLIGTPGLTTWANLSGQCVRGMRKFSDRYAFVVVGQNVYRIDSDGSFQLTGIIQYSNTPVYMESNGTLIFMATGPKGYIINPATNTLTEFTHAAFTGAGRVGFLNGSFVFNQPNTGKFWAMEPYSTTLDPLSFFTAEGSPDNIVTLLVDHTEIWLFGTETTEVWYYTGDTSTAAYRRIDGAFFEQGCAAAGSVDQMVDSLGVGAVYWLSANDSGQGMVFRATGFQPERISTHAIERAIASYDDISDAVAWTYQQEGHSFYVLNFPSANATWVYDSTTGMWHERAWRQYDGKLGRHRGNCHMFFGRRNLVGDWQNGNIYDMDLDTYSDDGNSIVRLRASPHLSQGNMVIGHSSVLFEMETGTGLQQGQGKDPKALIRWSDDGGHNWSSQRESSIGKVGSYKTQVRETRLGKSKDRVYELSISDPIKVVISGAYINE
ncbi:Bacteriophage P22, Gp10, DNA-stabilising [uncultured Caudovirales phage]|uniref:Bacteriophage P22, Gp10, DNA-stabilising n=1 Tax=uncultured Caudovirales phage TaxID=2100421 RepID=A0A6J5PGR1_9CAUD|nr:Bacteriophage P22, Gp10, DNA-stabilising [uncultured Caudovirales phage]